MGSELGLDLKLSAMKSITGFLKDASAADDAAGRSARLEGYVRSLEEEKRKIEAFRRELPLSALLITDVIRGLSEELEQCRGVRHTLEEFMPMKGKFEEEGGVKPEKDTRDKMNWMSSAQLWSDNYNNDDDSSKDSNNDNAKRKPEERDDEADRRHESKNACMESKPRIGGAFLPFKASSINGLSDRKDEKLASVVPDLSLVSPPIRSCSQPVSDVNDDNRCGGGGGGGGAGSKCSGRAPSAVCSQLGLQSQQQPPRKARRCWSPELHRRFVVALQQLGGAQVATPKQIRELMKVDGLTNDEVKSHLQKYRLHTRRMPNSSGAAAANRPVVVVGGLWVPQDHYTSSQQSASQSGSPQGPLQLAGSARAVSLTAGDSYEEEDGKSESYSWK